MSASASPATQLRHARADLKKFASDLRLAKAQCEDYRVRATKAEQQCAELKKECEAWSKRFDLLLEKSEKFATSE